MDFREGTNEGDRMEGVADPHHCETVGKFRNQMWSIGTLELNALVEIVYGLSKPQADDQERGEACRSTCELEIRTVDIRSTYRS